MKKHHHVEHVRFEDGKLLLTIDGVGKSFDLADVSDILSQASDQDLNNFEISLSGYGISWPSLDEDISIDGLLGIVHSPSQKRKIA